MIVIHTDGACSGNPGPGGYGVILVSGDSRLEISGAERDTTNNRMEMMAAIRGLQSLKGPQSCQLWTDSSYLRDGITKWIHNWMRNGWRTASKQPVKNEDLWRELWDLTGEHEIEWKWIKGHAGHKENERADRLAVAGCTRAKAGDEGELSGRPTLQI